MKNTHYFTINFTGFTTAACEEQNYLRLIEGERVFYTDKRYFKDPSLFECLKINQPLHIGTCRLRDGSFWIHWLSDGNVLLEPHQQPLKGGWFFGVLALIAAGLVAFSSAYWILIFTMLVVTSMLVSTRSLSCIFQNLSPKMYDLIAKMNLARRGDVSFCQVLNSTPPIPPDNIPPLANDKTLQEYLLLEDGVISNSYYKIWGNKLNGKYYSLREGVIFQFITPMLCFPAQFTWLVNSFTYNLHPIVYRRHPPFLADGDKIITARQHGYNDIQALYNVSSGSIYLKNSLLHPGRQQMSLIYKIAYGLVLIVTLFTLNIRLRVPQSDLEGLQYISEIFNVVFPILIPINIILIVMELGYLATRLLSRRIAHKIKLQQAIIRYARHAGASITPQELM
ncbi:hypothetical protein HV213_26070 [Klebsiella sp. RHBSTW-00484]|uniref:hypothetical protein n=1 Tax=unclassified Klebsiella TaxID=2608929 RepID=UPI0015E4F24A|nr:MULTISPECIES: hypothetical protein [unclassified Klebsiella]MBA7843686.1 hypothetical protein [Klebsiella sp. RHBSTW-00465]QLO34326.1 hypothetical protein HV213_26070 [Klebsiella sp. RHBSTW-00484]QLT73840.1 hypothetical protein HV204_26070 [Klebsiella sp. RHBSTW-00464]